MRRLSAVLLATVIAAPLLTAVVSSPAVPGSIVRAAGLSTPAVVVAAAQPVATKIQRVVLVGVDPVAAKVLLAQNRDAGTRSAPGAALLPSAAAAVLTAPTPTGGFQTLGVTWRTPRRAPDLLISVRSRGAKGWSGWDQLDDDTGDDPAVVSAMTRTAKAAKVTNPAKVVATQLKKAVRGGTDPFWVGPSDGVQVRIVVRSGVLPADLLLELVDPGTSDHDAVAAAAVPRPSVAGLPAGTLTAASANQPALFNRAQWGADERRVKYAPTYMPTVKGAVLHHTAGMNNYSTAQVPSIIRGDYAYHLSRGWSDIGYNALVDRFGRIWEGRAGGLDRAVMGAHAGGFNYDTFGVSVLGNYDASRPTTASVAAVARVMAWKLDLNHRDPFGRTTLTSSGGGTARYRSGRTVSLPVIMGHRDTGFTACPGRYLYPYLGSIRSQVRTLMKASLLNPSGPPASVLRGTKMSITARALVAQTWRLDVEAPFGAGPVARITGSVQAGKKITASWNGKLSDGSRARPGRYRLTLSSNSIRGTARPVIEDVLVVPPAPVAEIPTVPFGGFGGYTPVTPTRLLDTRAAGRIGLGPKGRVDIPVLGSAQVPAVGVTAVVLNLTASGVSDTTALSVWPSGRPTARRLTGVPAGGNRSILVTTQIGANGSVSVQNAVGVTELTADVVGYFSAGGSALHAIGATRIYPGALVPVESAGALVGAEPQVIPLPATLGGFPADQITGVVVDLSALSPTGPGTLTAYRPGETGDLPSVLYRSGESIDNLAFVPVSGGSIALRTTGTPVHVTVDVRAVLTNPGLTGPDPVGTAFAAVPPVELVDTRQTGGAIRAGVPRRLVVTGGRTGVPVGATAVVLDLTAIAPATRTWLQAYAWGQSKAYGTTLRVAKRDTRGNLLIVPVDPSGAIGIANARGRAQVRIDVYGYLH